MCLRIASIADYWQVQAREGGMHVGTPMPGAMPGLEAPSSPTASAADPLAARAQALGRKIDVAVTEAVASRLLAIALQEAPPLPVPGTPAKSMTERAIKAATARAATEAAAAVVAAAPSEGVPPAEQAEWSARLNALTAAASSGAAYVEAHASAPSWVHQLIKSTSVVVDQNFPPLVEHLRTIVRDGVAASVRYLQSAARSSGEPLDQSAARQKAQQVLNTLHAAVENVQQQFLIGLRSSLPPALSAQLGKNMLHKLCETAVNSRCDSLRSVTSHEDLTSRIWEEVSIVQDFMVGVSKQGAQQWLLALLLQTEKVALPVLLEEYIAVHISKHLDPYIDGDITCEKEERGTGPLLQKLRAAYEETFGREIPAPAELILALYVRHAISKSNATQCFTDLVMGQGRLPQTGEPQKIHCKALGTALEKAIERDFGKEHMKIQGVLMESQLLEDLSKEHSDKLFFDHQQNSQRLAEANRIGEIGRKEEMKRIFGIEV